MNNVYARIAVYFFSGAMFAGAIAMVYLNLATLDPVTGEFDVKPFNIYEVAKWLGAATAPVLTTLWTYWKWGTK